MNRKNRVGIFTLTHALNYGAFYQMYGMARYIESLGHEVTVFDCQRSIRYRALRLFSYNLRRQFRKAILMRSYSKDRKGISICAHRGQAMDIAILGSDEIWNLENRSFENAGEYVGVGINARYIAAYAPSIGYADPEALENNERFCSSIRKLDAIFARDGKTRAVAEKITQETIAEVIDPTILLYDWSEFIEKPSQPKERYILYYGYTGKPDFKDVLLELSKSTKLPIYTAGFHQHDWCDKNFTIGPKGFLNLIDGAEYVFTDTFHGLVMSTLLDKKVGFSAPMQKIYDYAAKIGIADSKISRTASLRDVLKILEESHKDRNAKLLELRDHSRQLISALVEQ